MSRSVQTLGIPVYGGYLGFATLGNTWYVAPDGHDTANGRDVTKPLLTIGRAIARATAGDLILVAPGTYAERFTVSKDNLTILGLGPRLGVLIQPASGTTTTVTVTGKQVHFGNLDISTFTGTAVGTSIVGDGFTCRGCKFETGDNAGVALDMAGAGTVGLTSSLAVIDDCEIAWCATGIRVNYSAEGTACTQSLIRNCWFHNFTAAGIGEDDSAGMTCANLVVKDSVFDDAEDGTAPTAYIKLNGSNTNTGIVTGCRFPTAIDSGKNLVSTAIHWVGNFHTGGVSAAQPS